MRVDGERVLQPQDPPCVANYKDLGAGASCTIPLTESAVLRLTDNATCKAGLTPRDQPLHGQRLEHANLNLYQALNLVIIPTTQERHRSYVDFGANAPQPSRWSASHSWGEPVPDFTDEYNRGLISATSLLMQPIEFVPMRITNVI